MAKRPKGRQYRNLYLRGGRVWIEFVVDGKRHHRSSGGDDWELAAQVRDEWKRELAGLPPLVVEQPTTFAEMAARYLRDGTSKLARTTLSDRTSLLRPDGPLVTFFGPMYLDAIDRKTLRRWWKQEIEGKGHASKTGHNMLGVLSRVLRHARDLDLVTGNDAVREFSQSLARGSNTKSDRAAKESKARPIEDPEALDRLVKAARKEGPEAAVTVLLCLDAGLRTGEAWALSWGDVTWGADVGRRELWIHNNRPRGGSIDDTPKSGRARKVALSLRLRDALAELYGSRWEPGPRDLVLCECGYHAFKDAAWRRIRKAADLGPVRLKDLRDTFASQLLTAGISLVYISRQLGHQGVGVTERHYARWTGGDDYVAPMQLGDDEVPADLLARLPSRSPDSESRQSGAAASVASIDSGTCAPSGPRLVQDERLDQAHLVRLEHVIELRHAGRD